MPANGTAGPDYSILAAFNGNITRPKTGAFYHGCLFMVAGTMLVLPLLYLSMMAFLAWAIYRHAIYDWKPLLGFDSHTGGILFIEILAYFVPLFAGIVVLFFMLKPLLARRPRHAQPLAMNPADNPLLYAFISKICDIVGAPAPARIDMDCQLNASAGFRRGFRSMTGHDLVLTIGLPLVANLSAREFAGVIAHEFGHFTQGAGMRLSYTIRAINFWFARVAYSRDAWDEALENWAAGVRDGRVALIVWSVQIAVWFSRLILKLLVVTSHVIAGFMLRQMEYNADAYQIQVVGSETTEASHRKLATLDAAMGQTYKLIRTRWKKDRCLPDNLCELLRQTHESLPKQVLQKIDDMLGFDRTGLFDFHPSAADRIRRARMAGAPGIFHDDRPASSLFASFEHPARFVTLLYYTDDLGIPITEKMLLRVESTQPKDAQGYLKAAPAKSAADEFFLGAAPLLMPLQMGPISPSANLEADATELDQLSERLHQIAAQMAPITEQYEKARAKLAQARTALRLLEAEIPIQAGDFSLPESSVPAARAAESEAMADRDRLSRSVREIAAALDRRIQLALSIRLADTGESGPNFVSPERIHELVAEINAAAAAYTRRRETLDALVVFDGLAAALKEQGETTGLSRALEGQIKLISSFLEEPPAETPMPAPATGLQLAKRPSHLSGTDFEMLRLQCEQWLSQYEETVNQLAEIALAAEKLRV